jgi:hypothetical protein
MFEENVHAQCDSKLSTPTERRENERVNCAERKPEPYRM